MFIWTSVHLSCHGGPFTGNHENMQYMMESVRDVGKEEHMQDCDVVLGVSTEN